MTFRGAMKRAALRALNVRPLPNPSPRGYDLFSDLRIELPCTQIRTVFDVGANTGQSAASFLKNFPEARIFSFEPAQRTYEQLCQSVAGTRGQPFQLAFGASNGTGFLAADPADSKLNRLADAGSESFPIRTLDSFCLEHDVDKIEFLKIDTEGHDLQVLMGAQAMLANGRIDIVEVEAGMNPTNEWHVPFESMKQPLEAAGYLLFGLYEQVREWKTGSPVLRRSNAVFISEAVAVANTRR